METTYDTSCCGTSTDLQGECACNIFFTGKKMKSTPSMSNQIGNHQCNNQLLSVLPRLPSFIASPLSIARFFDRVLPQATNRGEINEVIKQADRHHPTTLSSMEAPVFRRKINASARGQWEYHAFFLLSPAS